MNPNAYSSVQPHAQVSVGDILADKYRVDRVIGVGGMGVVVAATHLELETQVALKFLLPEVQANAEVVARFAREARAAVKIKSEYVARTLDVGRLSNGCPYIVMEYLEGTDLSHRLAESGRLPIQEAVRFILHACDALSEAHAMGIVHRDLKPSNLFLCKRRDGTEIGKILDFGISKLTQASNTGPGMDMTRTSSLMGSPLYMSPEQLVAARNVDPRADIWAIGVTLYEALTGMQPFQGETLPELCTRIMTQPPAPLTEYRTDLAPPLVAAVMRCLEKDPEQRFATIAEFAAAIRPFAPTVATGTFDRGSNALIDLPALAREPAAMQVAAAQAVRAVPTLNAWGQTNGSAEYGVPMAKSHLGAWVVGGLIVLCAPIAYFAFRSSPTTPPSGSPAAASLAAPVVTPAQSSPTQPLEPKVQVVEPSANTKPEATTAPAHQANAAPSNRPKAAAAPSGVTRPGNPGQNRNGNQKDLFGDRN